MVVTGDMQVFFHSPKLYHYIDTSAYYVRQLSCVAFMAKIGVHN